MQRKQKVVIFGGSKGIGKAIVDKLCSKRIYDVVEISRTSGYNLLDINVNLPVTEADFFIYSTGVGFFHDSGRTYGNIHKMIMLDLEIPILLTYKIKARHYIYIGSNSSYYGFDGSDVYCAVKHGILGFARALRKAGKKVSVVSPGTVDSSFWDNSGREKPELRQTPEDVANAVICCIENNADIEELLITPHKEDIK